MLVKTSTKLLIAAVLVAGVGAARIAVGVCQARLVTRVAVADGVVRRREARVTRRAANQSVGRGALDICDLRMTGRTLSRSLRWHGVVRVVTGSASLQRVVNHRIDLGESRRPGLIIRMAEDAKLSAPWRVRLLCRILDMRKRGPVAGLTRNGFVIALRLLRHLIDVAGPANRCAGECNFFRNLPFDGRLPMKLCVGQRRRENDISDCDHQRNNDRDHNR